MSLRIFGVHTVLELAPVLLATERLYNGDVNVRTGGVAHLVGGHSRPPIDPIHAGVSNFSPSLTGSGEADVATNAETQALRLSLDRPDIRIILTVTEGHYRIVARRSAGIGSLADLAGKRIGTMPWTSAAYYLHKELNHAAFGADAADIRHYSPAGALAEALIKEEVDAIAIWEPAAQEAIEALGGDAVELKTPGLYRELFNLNTTAAILDDPRKRQQIVEFTKAVVSACEQISQSAEAVWPIVEKVTGYPRRLIEAAWPHHRFVGTLPPDLLDVLVEEDTWIASENARPPRSRDALSSLIDDSIFREMSAIHR